jgi:hypothetical protein
LVIFIIYLKVAMMKSGGCGVILRMLVSPALQQQTTTDAV